MTMNNKKCSKCEVEKAYEDFYGVGRSWCKDCDSKKARYRMGQEKNRFRTAYRRAKKTAEKHGAYDTLTMDDVFYTFAIAGGRCSYCGKLVGRGLNLEHIAPLSRGGHNVLANITTSCGTCNKRKGAEAILTHTQTNSFDTDLILSLINRMAYRQDVHRSEMIELLEQQQRDYSREDVRKLFDRIKRNSKR